MYATRSAAAEFERKSSGTARATQADAEWLGPVSKIIYAGVSMTRTVGNAINIAIAIRDVVYPLDYVQEHLQVSPNQTDPAITNYITGKLKQYSEENHEKVIGLGLPSPLLETCPGLTSRLWLDLDIIPLVVHVGKISDTRDEHTPWESRAPDEQAEILALQCVRLFGPDNIPLLLVGHRGLVEVDYGFHVHISSLKDYECDASPEAWSMLQTWSSRIRHKGTKIAMFSATPQGGGVALMRHAFLRLAKLLDLDIKWYVPQPRSSVFRVTKMNHNILQGVSTKDDYFSEDDEALLHEWVSENAIRYWTSSGGPLDNPLAGGADVVVVDDPQVPDLIPIAKQKAPDRPVIYRNHIQIRNDLTSKAATAQARTWDWLWKRAQRADAFISHPIPGSVPHDVPEKMRQYMPASTDVLDGLNKNMREWDIAHYGRIFNHWCRDIGMPLVDYPSDEYITQIARFDPSKGILTAVDAYHKFHSHLTQARPNTKVPKLVLCGHGSVDDPDATRTYNEVVNRINKNMLHLKDLIIVVRLRPSDQVLNAVLSRAKIVLQLSTCEGFEIKISEALRKGKPVIATNVGGLPYQVSDGETGFLVKANDSDQVASRLFELWDNQALYNRVRDQALSVHRDELTTVGHLASWLYLIDKLLDDQPWKPEKLVYKAMCEEFQAN